jgi:hypothetical protein
MRSWIERGYWAFMLRTSRVLNVRGLRFLYITAERDRPPEEITGALEEALRRISDARGGFGELVTSHLRFVAALDGRPAATVLVHAQGYVSPFPRVEVDNPLFLACRLIWAATFIRLSRDALAQRGPRDLSRIRQAAHEAQKRFVNQFPDPGDWLEYLEQHASGT